MENNFKLIVERAIRNFNTIDGSGKFELYAEDNFVKEWVEPAAYLGEKINSPYNYDSWKIVKYESVIEKSIMEFVYGEIVFTITNEDLK